MLSRKESPESLRVLYSIFSAFAAFGGDRATHAVIPASEPSLDSQRFAKLCRDCNLLDGQLLTSQAVDVIFARAKGSPKSRRLDFLQFRKALALLAEVKFGSNPFGLKAIISHVIATCTSIGGGPQLENVHRPKVSSTVYEKLFDDHITSLNVSGTSRSKVQSYTAASGSPNLYIHLRPTFRGGTHMSNFAKARASAQIKSDSPIRVEKRSWSSPSQSASAVKETVSSITSPQSESLQSRNLPLAATPVQSSEIESRLATSPTLPHWEVQSNIPTSPLSTEKPSLYSDIIRPKQPKVIIESPELESIFLAYCAFGTTTKLVEELDSARFMKLCRETGICDGKVITPAIVDVTFAKVKAASGGGGENKAQSRRTISYETFCQALAMLAPMRHPNKEMATGLQYDVEQIIAAGGPSVVSSSIEKIQGVYERLTQ